MTSEHLRVPLKFTVENFDEGIGKALAKAKALCIAQYEELGWKFMRLIRKIRGSTIKRFLVFTRERVSWVGPYKDQTDPDRERNPHRIDNQWVDTFDPYLQMLGFEPIPGFDSYPHLASS